MDETTDTELPEPRADMPRRLYGQELARSLAEDIRPARGYDGENPNVVVLPIRMGSGATTSRAFCGEGIEEKFEAAMPAHGFFDADPPKGGPDPASDDELPF